MGNVIIFIVIKLKSYSQNALLERNEGGAFKAVVLKCWFTSCGGPIKNTHSWAPPPEALIQ